MKKSFIFFVSLIFLVLLSNHSWAGPNKVAGCAVDMDITTIDYDQIISQKDIEQNIEGNTNEIWIGIIAQDVINLDTYTVEVSFDPDRLQFIQGAEENPFGGIGNILKKNRGKSIGFQVGLKDNNLKDTVVIANALAYSNKEEAPEGSGFLALLQFRIIDNKPNNFISLQQVSYVDSDAIVDPISTISNGVINGGVNNCVGNSLPEISNISDRVVVTNSSTENINFTVNDNETDASQLNVKITSNNQTLLPDQNITSGSISDTNRTISVIPVNNQRGIATITIQISDECNASVNETFDLIVNSTPEISSIPDQTTKKNTPIEISFTVNDQETSLDELTISFNSTKEDIVPTENINIIGTGQNRLISITPAVDKVGEVIITITVTDEYNESSSTNFKLSISKIDNNCNSENEKVTIKKVIYYLQVLSGISF